jgi:hypothetical protein
VPAPLIPLRAPRHVARLHAKFQQRQWIDGRRQKIHLPLQFSCCQQEFPVIKHTLARKRYSRMPMFQVSLASRVPIVEPAAFRSMKYDCDAKRVAANGCRAIRINIRTLLPHSACQPTASRRSDPRLFPDWALLIRGPTSQTVQVFRSGVWSR